MSGRLLAIGELARRTGVAVSALRYYEDVGLLQPAKRVSGHRRYSTSAVQTVGMILLFREVGFSVREAAELMAKRPDSLERRKQMARVKIAELDGRIAKAQGARTALEHSLRCRHKDFEGCPNFAAAVETRLRHIPLEKGHPH
jgi:DNA-binding transcriptional MerR regulator